MYASSYMPFFFLLIVLAGAGVDQVYQSTS
jgi:hypothetical protein